MKTFAIESLSGIMNFVLVSGMIIYIVAQTIFRIRPCGGPVRLKALSLMGYQFQSIQSGNVNKAVRNDWRYQGRIRKVVYIARPSRLSESECMQSTAGWCDSPLFNMATKRPLWYMGVQPPAVYLKENLYDLRPRDLYTIKGLSIWRSVSPNSQSNRVYCISLTARLRETREGTCKCQFCFIVFPYKKIFQRKKRPKTFVIKC